MKISRKQREFLSLLEDPTINELLIGGAGGGPLVFGSKVKTPFGEKNIEDIEIGDQVSNANGGVSRVIDIPYEGVDDCYKITFIDGATVECSSNHIWKYKLAGQAKRKYLDEFTLGTTRDLLEKSKKYNVLIPLCKPVVFTRSFKQDKISPYLLGVLLGDGGIYKRGINIFNPDPEIIERCKQEISGEIWGKGDGLTWRLKGCKYEYECLEKFGLMGKHSWEKFIPECYKMGSIKERFEVLRGLLDTDGTVDSRGHTSFTSTSKQLAEDVQFIARSLGANATLTADDNAGYRNREGDFIKCRLAYTVYIQHEHKEDFFYLSRKKDRVKPYNNGAGVPSKRILSIKPIGKKKVRCISVSSLDGLFLTNDFVVTHNSKTLSMGLGIVLLARKYPGARFFVGRKTLKSLKQSTINTLLTKVMPLVGMKKDEYAMHYQDMVLDFKNGAVIVFGELDYAPSDPDFSRVGSMEYDFAFIDEAGEITLQAKNAIKTRVGRGKMSTDYGVPGKLILSANPSTNFLYSEYFEPYDKLGGGEFQKWQIGETVVYEGRENEQTLPSYRAFLRMGAYDNPFLPRSYIDNLKTLPDRERKRILDGDWHYADDESSLFRSGLLDKATTYNLPTPSEKFNKFIGADVSDIGTDLSVFSLIENGVLTTQKVSSVQMTWDKNSRQPMGRLLADELVEFAQRNGFTQTTARQIAVETNGVGASIRDFLRDRGWQVTEYTATHKSRSQNYYQLMLDMDAGDLKIYSGIQEIDGLRKELSAHSYTMSNQEPDVVKKDKIKQAIGHSPDRADSLSIANYARRLIENPELNPRTNKNRIYA